MKINELYRYINIEMLEGALTVGGISIATLIIAKLECYVKKNGAWTFGCGFIDKPLIDDCEIEIKTVELGDVHALYVKNKHHEVIESEDEEREA